MASDYRGRLKAAEAVLVIVTPLSIERPWLWFEIGATWLKGREHKCRIFPLCTPEVEFSELPEPLSRLQALSLGKSSDIRTLFQDLSELFECESRERLKTTNISRRIPKYADVRLDEADLRERALYSGNYDGYNDDELMEVIDTGLFYRDGLLLSLQPDLGREESIHNGKLIHFGEVDRKLELPHGTARRLLDSVAERYGLVPDLEMTNVIRYRPKSHPKVRRR